MLNTPPSLALGSCMPAGAVPEPLAELRAVTTPIEPAFLSSQERQQAVDEHARLAALDSGSNEIGRRVLEWARRHPEDPRVPESLHRVVRGLKVGCSTEATAAISRAAFQLLHRRYGNTPASALTNSLKLTILGNAALEGADALAARFTSRVRRQNYTQIFTSTVDVTGTLQAVRDLLIQKAVRRSLDPKLFDFRKIEEASRGTVRQTVKLRQGIDQDLARQISKLIRDRVPKVRPQIQGDAVRVSGKNKDDLQAAIKLLREQDYTVPLQFVNYR